MGPKVLSQEFSQLILDILARRSQAASPIQTAIAWGLDARRSNGHRAFVWPARVKSHPLAGRSRRVKARKDRRMHPAPMAASTARLKSSSSPVETSSTGL